MLRSLPLVALTGGIILASAPVSAETVTDLAGREVAIPETVERIVLGEGRMSTALAILDTKAPLGRVVGMMGDFSILDPSSYRQWQETYPEIDEIARVGKASPDSFSTESTIALSPDLAIFGLAGHGPGPTATEALAQLEAAGVTVVFIDFFLDPLVNTPKSIELLGKVLGREQEAEAFVEAYNSVLDRVTDRVAQAPDRPTVFLENRVGLLDGCCHSVGRGVLGLVVEAAGGDNVAADLLPGYAGTISLEHLLTNQPDIYLGTGIGSPLTIDKYPDFIVLGPGTDAATARTSLVEVLDRTGVEDLEAVREGRAYAIWHHYFHSPFNVIALQAMASWFHPDLFADVDPEEVKRTMMDRFQSVPLDGVYWIGVE